MQNAGDCLHGVDYQGSEKMSSKLVDILAPTRGQPMKSQRVNIIQPADLLEAMKARAASRGLGLSQYIGELALADLPQKVARKIAPRPTVGAPRKSHPRETT